VLENQNWKSKLAHSFKNIKDLYLHLDWPLPDNINSVALKYPIFVPLSLANKIKNEGPEGILAKEFLPSHLENDGDLNSFGLIDPIGDKSHLKAPQLIHRYHSRALFTPTSICPVHCRYCFRKNELTATEDIFQNDFEKTLQYLKNHSEISEIIFTGGDPLTLSNEKIEHYLRSFEKIKSIKHIRFHTRYPIILPERIDTGFIDIMSHFSKRFTTLSIAIHSNHLNEFDEINSSAIKILAKTDVQLLGQTVLLRGVNDSEKALIELFEKFIEIKIRPYYLHHPDRVQGGMHFYLPIAQGRELYQGLRQKLPGWALPQYVIDIPEGLGKTQVYNPEDYHFSGKLISKDGKSVQLREPDLFV
jgi:lysine 2,3-aminomutase